MILFGNKLRASDSFSLIKTTYKNKTLNYTIEDISALKPKKKTIIMICGNNTKDPLKATNYAMHGYNWASGYKPKKDITTYSIFYPKNQPLINGMSINPAFNYEELAEIIFRPIIFNEKTPKKLDDIIDTFSSITFFGHSMGGYIMNELAQNLGKMLKENNFTSAEIKKIYSSIVFIGYSPFALVDAPTKNIYITPIYDSVGSSKLAYDKLLDESKVAICNPTYKKLAENKLKHTSYNTFLKSFIQNEEESLYFGAKNNLFCIPNLLFDDGIKEDHNRAGVINYPMTHPHKTNAGKITTEFLNNAFAYSLYEDRNKFSIQELYKKAVNDLQQNKDEQNK